MKHIIYSDIDGTLYPKTKEIHKANYVAIEKAQKLGLEFVITTGNGWFEVMQELAERLKTRYVITSNGACIYDKHTQEFLFKNMMSEEVSMALKEFAIEHDIQSSCWNEENFYSSTTNTEIVGIIEAVMMGDQGIKSLTEANKEMFKFESYDSPEKIDKIEAFAKSLDLQCARMNEGMVEITNVNVSKGHAVKWLNNHLGIEADNFMTIGDSPNDHSMLAITQYSYAMANSKGNTFDIAKLNTSSVEQGGLAEAIDDFLYRKKIEA